MSNVMTTYIMPKRYREYIPLIAIMIKESRENNPNANPDTFEEEYLMLKLKAFEKRSNIPGIAQKLLDFVKSIYREGCTIDDWYYPMYDYIKKPNPEFRDGEEIYYSEADLMKAQMNNIYVYKDMF